MLISIVQFVQDYGFIGGVILLLCSFIYYLLKQLLNEDRAALFRSRIYKGLLHFSTKREYEKKYISNDIRGRLNLARADLCCGDVILPKAIDVEWIEGTEPKTYDIADGQFVVCLDPTSQQEQNIVRLAELLAKRTSLIGIRHLIDKPLRIALNTTLTKRLLRQTEITPALTWLHQNIIDPILKNGGPLTEWHTKVVEIDDQCLFHTLLLVELEEYSRRVSGKERRLYMIDTIESLVNFVHEIATKKPRVEVQLEYARAHLKVAVILVARADTILYQGIDPYVTTAKNKARKAYIIYLIIWGKSHLKKTRPDDFLRYERRCKKLAKKIEKLPGVYKSFEVTKYKYIDPNGRHCSGRLIRYVVNQKC